MPERADVESTEFSLEELKLLRASVASSMHFYSLRAGALDQVKECDDLLDKIDGMLEEMRDDLQKDR